MQTAPFESTIALPGLGQDARASGAVIERAIASCHRRGLHLQSATLARGSLVLKGDYDQDVVQSVAAFQAIVAVLGRELVAVMRVVEGWAPDAGPGPKKALPRSVEDQS